MQRYFPEQYVFTAPYRPWVWLRLFRCVVPLHRRFVLRVHRLELRGIEYLRHSLERGAGVVLAPNHWSLADGPLIGALGLEAGTYCYYLVSHHIFRRSRLFGWLINRAGGYSVLREGTDRESLRAGVQILANAERPLVIFAEGTWYRQNDRLGPLQQGAALIARMAARHSGRPVVFHPIAIKYWLLKDPRAGLARRLDDLERHLGCPGGGSRNLVERIERVTVAWLVAQERAHLGGELAGDAEERRLRLLDELIARLEEQELGRTFGEPPMDRVRRLRGILVRRLADGPASAETARAFKRLDVLYLCECLFAHSLTYLREQPSWERIAESVQRLGEIVWDRFEPPVAPMGVVVETGPAIDVTARDQRRPAVADRHDALMERLAETVQGMLDRLSSEGPPPSWKAFYRERAGLQQTRSA